MIHGEAQDAESDQVDGRHSPPTVKTTGAIHPSMEIPCKTNTHTHTHTTVNPPIKYKPVLTQIKQIKLCVLVRPSPQEHATLSASFFLTMNCGVIKMFESRMSHQHFFFIFFQETTNFKMTPKRDIEINFDFMGTLNTTLLTVSLCVSFCLGFQC